MDTKQRLARRLRAARIERGLTQAEVGRALNLHRPAISEIEAGRRSVTSEELYSLSRVLSVPLSDLMPPPAVAATEPSTGPPAETSHSDATPGAIPEVILEMARTIVERFGPERIILFGSHARGTADPDSDVDLLVVMAVEGSTRRAGASIGAALHGFPVPKDVIVTTPAAFNVRKGLPGTIERTAALEGRVLHAPG